MEIQTPALLLIESCIWRKVYPVWWQRGCLFLLLKIKFTSPVPAELGLWEASSDSSPESCVQGGGQEKEEQGRCSLLTDIHHSTLAVNIFYHASRLSKDLRCFFLLYQAWQIRRRWWLTLKITSLVWVLSLSLHLCPEKANLPTCLRAVCVLLELNGWHSMKTDAILGCVSIRRKKGPNQAFIHLLIGSSVTRCDFPNTLKPLKRSLPHLPTSARNSSHGEQNLPFHARLELQISLRKMTLAQFLAKM